MLRVGESRVSLESVISSWSQGNDPESIRRQYPALTLAEVYGAIAWSLSHAEETAEYLKQQDALWEQLRQRSEIENGPLLERLREARARAGRT